MNADELAAIRERAEAASNGPWGVYESAHGAGVECGSADADDVGQLFVESYGLTYTPNPADAEFIAHAREDIPALLDHADTLQDRLDKVRDVLDAPWTDLSILNEIEKILGGSDQ